MNKEAILEIRMTDDIEAKLVLVKAELKEIIRMGSRSIEWVFLDHMKDLADAMSYEKETSS